MTDLLAELEEKKKDEGLDLLTEVRSRFPVQPPPSVEVDRQAGNGFGGPPVQTRRRSFAEGEGILSEMRAVVDEEVQLQIPPLEVEGPIPEPQLFEPPPSDLDSVLQASDNLKDPQALRQATAKVVSSPAGETSALQSMWNEAVRGHHIARQAHHMAVAIASPKTLSEFADDIVETRRSIRSIPTSEALQRFQQQGFLGAVKEAALNPLDVAAPLIAGSLVSFGETGVPLAIGGGLVGGVAAAAAAGPLAPVTGAVGARIGAALGAGTGSLLIEASSEFFDFVEQEIVDRGLDPDKPDDWRTVLADKEVVAEARKGALRKGIPIAILDAISVGVAGRLTSIAKGPIKKIVASTGEIGVQGALGGAGETLGQLAQEGKITDPAGIAAEIVAEFGPGGVKVAGGVALERGKGRGQSSSAAPSRPAGPTPVAPAKPVPPVAEPKGRAGRKLGPSEAQHRKAAERPEVVPPAKPPAEGAPAVTKPKRRADVKPVTPAPAAPAVSAPALERPDKPQAPVPAKPVPEKVGEPKHEEIVAKPAGEEVIGQRLSRVTKDFAHKDSKKFFSKTVSALTTTELKTLAAHAESWLVSASPNISRDGERLGNQIFDELKRRGELATQKQFAPPTAPAEAVVEQVEQAPTVNVKALDRGTGKLVDVEVAADKVTESLREERKTRAQLRQLIDCLGRK